MPAKATMVVTADARAQPAAGTGSTVGRRVHTVRHGQGKTARTEQLETEVVGTTGLTTDDRYGTAEHGHVHNRWDFQANPIHAAVVRQWDGWDYGPGGQMVFLTNASVDTPLLPFDDNDDRSLIEHGSIKAPKQPWNLGHPPQLHDRAERVHVMCTLLGNTFLHTEIGEPIPGEETLHGDNQTLPRGGDSLEQGFRRGFHLAVHKHVSIVAQDADIHGASSQLDTTVTLVLLG